MENDERLKCHFNGYVRHFLYFGQMVYFYPIMLALTFCSLVGIILLVSLSVSSVEGVGYPFASQGFVMFGWNNPLYFNALEDCFRSLLGCSFQLLQNDFLTRKKLSLKTQKLAKFFFIINRYNMSCN